MFQDEYREGYLTSFLWPRMLSLSQDSMRRWLLPFQGYRVVVTEPDGSQHWASVPRQGSNLFTEDHRSSGTSGGQWRAKRVPHAPRDFSEVGYNQVSSLTCPSIY